MYRINMKNKKNAESNNIVNCNRSKTEILIYKSVYPPWQVSHGDVVESQFTQIVGKREVGVTFQKEL